MCSTQSQCKQPQGPNASVYVATRHVINYELARSRDTLQPIGSRECGTISGQRKSLKLVMFRFIACFVSFCRIDISGL